MKEAVVADVSAPRLRAGEELRRIREGLGLSGTAVAAALGWSQSKVSRVETGRFGATVWELASLADFYGLAEEVRAEILATAAEESGLPGAWTVRAGGSSRRQTEVAAIEPRTRLIRQYQSAVVPGLLQAPGYARAVAVAGGFGDPEGVAARRMQRQGEAFDGESPSTYAAVVEEAALLRSAGTAEVFSEQLEHLLAASERPGTDLRLLPIEAKTWVAAMNSFVIYDFISRESPSVVLVETQTTDLYLSDKADLRAYNDMFERLQSAALTPRATATELRRLLGSGAK